MIDSMVRQCLEKGGEPDVLLVSNIQKAKLNNLKIARVQGGGQQQSDKAINNLVDIYESEAGPLKIVRSNDVFDTDLWLVDSKKVRVMPLQGRRFGIEPLSKVGDKDESMIVGEYTAEVHNPEVLFKIKNLATSV
jgi:hypothetical protein